MRHEVIRSTEEWRTLREGWNSLLESSRANQIFMSWEWLDSWLLVHPEVTALTVICVYDDDGQLAGAAPFYKADYVLLGMLPYRALRLIGDVDSGAEYQMWIARAADESVVCAEIVRCLRALNAEWDLLWMPNVCSWTEAQQVAVNALQDLGLGVRTRPRGFSSVRLPADYDSYLAEMSPNRRQQVRRNTKKILAKPGVKVRRVTSPTELGSTLDALFRLHGKRWRSVGKEGVFDRNPRERAFYLRFAPQALARGWLAMFVLEDGTEAKAVQIGYLYRGVLLQLQEGFDPEYSPHVGNALRAWAIQQCIESGITEYDFLGGHSEHKRRWLAVERSGMDILGFGPGLRGLPMRLGVWPTGRYLRPVGATGELPPKEFCTAEAP
jgi:hypothetical protein